MPDPLTLKLLLVHVPVMPEGTAFYTSAEAAKDSPLAVALFAIPGVSAVFLAADFLSVTRDEAHDSATLKPSLLHIIMEHFLAGKPVIRSSDYRMIGSSVEEDSDIVKQIKELIETRVRPAVAMDGGDIVFHGFETHRAAGNARRVLRLPQLHRHAEIRHREHAQALCAGSGGRRGGLGLHLLPNRILLDPQHERRVGLGLGFRHVKFPIRKSRGEPEQFPRRAQPRFH